ncbi:HET-domain-containing protein, partial [Mollisia scopiformis]
LPEVIEDSIFVTSSLGIQYLWVDRYCINQQDAADKHEQISNMDVIYANATITIIAAAGSDPDYGLPGVNGRMRKLRPNLKMRKLNIYASLPQVYISVKKSKWATRGWTYQEGLLSKRRLIFTDEQVHFDCNSICCAEESSLLLDRMFTSSSGNSMAHTEKGALPLKMLEPFDTSLISRLIAESSKRELGYPEDTLNAMQGIFRVF